MIPALEAILGNRTAAAALLFIANYGSGYAREMARTYEIPLSAVQDQLQKLEAAGVLVSRTVGRTRLLSLILETRRLADCKISCLPSLKHCRKASPRNIIRNGVGHDEPVSR